MTRKQALKRKREFNARGSRCPNCGLKYAVGRIVKLIPLTSEEIDYCNESHMDFSTVP